MSIDACRRRAPRRAPPSASHAQHAPAARRPLAPPARLGEAPSPAAPRSPAAWRWPPLTGTVPDVARVVDEAVPHLHLDILEPQRHIAAGGRGGRGAVGCPPWRLAGIRHGPAGRTRRGEPLPQAAAAGSRDWAARRAAWVRAPIQAPARCNLEPGPPQPGMPCTPCPAPHPPVVDLQRALPHRPRAPKVLLLLLPLRVLDPHGGVPPPHAPHLVLILLALLQGRAAAAADNQRLLTKEWRGRGGDGGAGRARRRG